MDTIQSALGDTKDDNKKDVFPLKKNPENKEYPTLPVTDHPLYNRFAS